MISMAVITQSSVHVTGAAPVVCGWGGEGTTHMTYTKCKWVGFNGPASVCMYTLFEFKV